MKDTAQNLGEPDIKIAGLAIWIHGREFPDSKEYWDVNWLNVTVCCGAQGASVKADGSIIFLSEISELLSGVEGLYNGSNSEVRMACIEPYLAVTFKAETLGHIKMSVDITPDHLSQKHNFVFEIDQSYLPQLISECKTVLKEWPLIGKP